MNYGLEIDHRLMDQSQNLFRKTNGKIKEHSDTITQVYTKFFGAERLMVYLHRQGSIYGQLEAFINFYINEKFSAAKPHAENPWRPGDRSVTVRFYAMKTIYNLHGDLRAIPDGDPADDPCIIASFYDSHSLIDGPLIATLNAAVMCILFVHVRWNA